MSDIAKILAVVRKFTGKSFSAEKGYDLRKPLSRRRIKTIERYYDKIAELTAKPFVKYKPKKGESWEAFEYTGQTGFPRFKTAFFHKPNSKADLIFTRYKSRPVMSQFVAIDRRNGQLYYHIPASVFLMKDEPIFADLINYYAPDAEFFLIQAGASYMWGAGGGSKEVAKKIASIMKNYGASMFDANNKNSHYYGNWFRGITGFTDRFDAMELIDKAATKRRQYMAAHNITSTDKARVLKNGMIGIYRNGKLLKRLKRG